MSGHQDTGYARERVVAAGARQLPAWIRQVSIGLAVLGLAIFLFGVLSGDHKTRAWHAFQVNWLFFSTISSAAVMFVAVQRITTARWSRGIARIMEGFGAFLPVAFIGLVVLVLFGGEHAYPWWNELGELKHEKQVYLGHTFFTLRSILAFAAIMVDRKSVV